MTRPFLLAIAAATLLAAALRAYGVTGQVVLDDEWHAIHKLQSSWGDIATSFGWADHSIPLTLLYKAMAETIGLAEGRLRAPQFLAGVATVPLAAWIAWRALRDAPAAALFAFLVAGAPFLVMWSRFARPYAMTPLLALACVACVWRWRTTRGVGLAVGAAASAALLAWLHPLCAVFPALACLFVFLEDVARPRGPGPRPTRSSLALGAAVAAAMALPLLPPLLADFSSLRDKAGGDQPTLATFRWLMDVWWGGLPPAATGAACALSGWGLVVVARRAPRLAAYLAVLGLVPPLAVTLTGALWVHSGQNFGRYVLPVQLLLLFLGAFGAIDVARRLAPARAEAAAWIAATALAMAYLAATPAIVQVATLGPWYAHIDYHWNYRYPLNEGKHADPGSYPRPAFYREVLERAAPGTMPILEAPFNHRAPSDDLAFYATAHRQPETFGMLHGLCGSGPREGEVPAGDRRFRFRKFVFLHDPQDVRRSGARYLVFHRRMPRASPHQNAALCLERLAGLYGPPVRLDERVAVFDLGPAPARRKLQ